MVTKMTVKNQLTIPKKILERANLFSVKDEDRYFDIEITEGGILLKPVTLIVEERIPDKQWEKFENWATTVEKGDVICRTSKKATTFLKKKMYKKT